MENSVSEASLYLQDQVSGPWSRPQGPRPPRVPGREQSSPSGDQCGVTFLLLWSKRHDQKQLREGQSPP